MKTKNNLPKMWTPILEGSFDSLIAHDTCQWCNQVMTNTEIDIAKGDNIALCKKCRVDNALADIMTDDLRRNRDRL